MGMTTHKRIAWPVVAVVLVGAAVPGGR
jgi:hypothetical protein